MPKSDGWTLPFPQIVHRHGWNTNKFHLWKSISNESWATTLPSLRYVFVYGIADRTIAEILYHTNHICTAERSVEGKVNGILESALGDYLSLEILILPSRRYADAYEQLNSKNLKSYDHSRHTSACHHLPCPYLLCAHAYGTCRPKQPLVKHNNEFWPNQIYLRLSFRLNFFLHKSQENFFSVGMWIFLCRSKCSPRKNVLFDKTKKINEFQWANTDPHSIRLPFANVTRKRFCLLLTHFRRVHFVNVRVEATFPHETHTAQIATEWFKRIFALSFQMFRQQRRIRVNSLAMDTFVHKLIARMLGFHVGENFPRSIKLLITLRTLMLYTKLPLQTVVHFRFTVRLRIGYIQFPCIAVHNLIESFVLAVAQLVVNESHQIFIFLIGSIEVESFEQIQLFGKIDVGQRLNVGHMLIHVLVEGCYFVEGFVAQFAFAIFFTVGTGTEGGFVCGWISFELLGWTTAFSVKWRRN